MRMLLDSQVLIWASSAPKKIPENVRTLIDSENSIVLFSSVSIWELKIKESLGKLSLPKNFVSKIIEAGYQELVLKSTHTEHLSELPPHHSDPFDRMLIAQCLSESLTFISSDKQVKRYPINVLWSSK